MINLMESLQIVKQIFASAKTKNPKMTLRFAAAKMKISYGRLSELLNGKRVISDYYLEKLCQVLKPSPEELEQLLRARNKEENEVKQVSHGQLLTSEQVTLLSNWKPYALMSLFQTVDYKQLAITIEEQEDWIAKKFELPASEISSLIYLLSHLKLIVQEQGKWHVKYGETTTGFDIPSIAIQESFLEDLNLAKEKIKKYPVSLREFGSVTLTMNPKEIWKAKKLIRQFQKDFTEKMEKTEAKEVFQISVQFFPLTQFQEND